MSFDAKYYNTKNSLRITTDYPESNYDAFDDLIDYIRAAGANIRVAETGMRFCPDRNFNGKSARIGTRIICRTEEDKILVKLLLTNNKDILTIGNV